MKNRKRIGSLVLSAAMAASMLGGVPQLAVTAQAATSAYEPTETVEHDGATFGRATEAYGADYVGFPLFNGNEDDFDEYLDLLIEEMGTDGVIALAAGGTATGSYTNASGETVTYTIPAGKAQGGEALQGAANQTALSTVMYQAQSWNIDLINDIGYLMGSENKSKLTNGGYNYASSTGTSMTDMRLNPLSGRYDEGYGEDSTMASLFAAANASGYNGYETDEDGFYIMAAVNTKHYSVYNAQWFRPVTSTQVGVRSFYEYNAKSANRGFEEGSISSFMSSYGRINGVPSSASFIAHWANFISKYDLYNGTDAGADNPYLTMDQAKNYTYGQFGNGYDVSYSPDANWKASSMAVSGNKSSGGVSALSTAIACGYNGVSIDSCRPLASAYLTIRTRTGIYDEKDENGLSKYYPFNEVASNGSEAVNYESESSQDVALQNAEEGIVLLKNDNDVLPLSTDDNVGVYGVFSEAINSGIYQVGVSDYTGRGDEAGATGYEAISARVADASYDMGLNVVTITTSDGGYWYVDGTTIEVKTAEEFEAAEDKDNYYFGILDSGQDASSIYSYGAEKWLRCAISDPTIGYDAYVGRTSPLFDNSFQWRNASYVAVDDSATFINTPNNGLPPINSGYPYHLVLESAGADNTYYIHAGAKVNGVTFVTGVAPIMTKNYGYYLEVQNTEELGNYINLGGAAKGDNSSLGGGIDYFNNAADKSAMTFTVNEVQPYGYAAADAVEEDDAAIIYVGQSYLGLSGEGTDRVSLDMGEGQIESALNVAQTYKEAGKDTVVVIYANYPVVAEELQNSEYVDAIVFAGYGGQFGGKATAEVLTGEYAPTGRLVSTWYKDMDLFPEITEYTIPQGNDDLQPIADEGLTLDQIDDSITVDMTDADVYDTGLTYKYLTDEEVEEHVTYPFGYGLSYTDFSLDNMTVTPNKDGTYTVYVKVKNTGSVSTSEVVQIYVSKTDGSAYGDATPNKSLAGFAKVYVAAHGQEIAEITVDPTDFAVWDVNAEDYVVESGSYNFYAAEDSSLTGALIEEVNITGDEIADLPLNEEVNIWEHSYNASDVHYDEYSKVQTAYAAANEEVGDDIYAVTAKDAGAWTVLSNVDLTKVVSAELTAGAPAGVNGTVELRADAPDGAVIASFDVTETGAATVELASNTEEKTTVTEQGYNTLTSDVADMSGVHDVYVVFGTKDLRAATLTFTESTIEDGLANSKAADGKWYYYTNGKVDTSYTGLAKNKNGWFYVNKGVVDFTKNSVVKNDKGWWKVTNGKVDFTFTGLAKNENGWWYLENGKVDFTKNSVVKNSAGWWKVTKGKVDFTFNGLAKNENGWWYLVNGKVDFSYTGLAKNSAGTWYVKGGKVQFSYTGTVKIGTKSYKVVKGQVQ